VAVADDAGRDVLEEIVHAATVAADLTQTTRSARKSAVCAARTGHGFADRACERRGMSTETVDVFDEKAQSGALYLVIDLIEDA
jgi:hypothetical protein